MRSAASGSSNAHQQPNGEKTPTSNEVDGDSIKINGYENTQLEDYSVQQLPKRQQDILLLHGPRQRYCLKKGSDIPELHSSREILVQVSRAKLLYV